VLDDALVLVLEKPNCLSTLTAEILVTFNTPAGCGA
jgi:hypothetical protein